MIRVSKPNFATPRDILVPFLRRKTLEKRIWSGTTEVEPTSIVLYLQMKSIKSHAIDDEAH
jgi:hypothetical protein